MTKPFRLQDAAQACQQALATYQASLQSKQPRSPSTEAQQGVFVGRSPAMQQVFRKIALVAESELFGHVKGAFTGASEDRRGLFELAHGGTVLLDEIGDLPLGTQVKLLRVLEQGEFNRVGDVRPRRCDVRIIAATNCDLHAKAAEGTFRQDLLYRLSAVHIHLPPLRQRREDIPLLCENFLLRIGYPQKHCAVDEPLAQALAARPWQGNVRELRNAVEHASVVARGRKLTIRDFPEPQSKLAAATERTDGEELRGAIERWAERELEAGDAEEDNLHRRFLRTVELPFLQTVLRHSDGNRAATAKRLGIDRGTLRERLRHSS